MPEDSSIATTVLPNDRSEKKTPDKIGHGSKNDIFLVCSNDTSGAAASPLVWFVLFFFVEIRDFGSEMKADQLRHSPGRCVRLHVNGHQSEQRPTTQLSHMIRPGILIT